MAVGEAEDAGVVVACRNEIDPEPDAGLIHIEAAVLDAAFAFVDEDKCLGGSWLADFRSFVPARLIIQSRIIIHVHAHRNAADTRDFSFVANGRFIGGAFVDLGVFVVGIKAAGLDIGGVSIGVGVAFDPGSCSRVPSFTARARAAFVGRKIIIVILVIHLPAELKLAVVVETFRLMRFCFGLAEGWQEEAGEDRDDGDDD
jgi:hypothetical protein